MSATLPVELVCYYKWRDYRRWLPGGRVRRLDGVDSLRLQLLDTIGPHLPEHIDLRVSGLALGGPLRRWNFNRWLQRLRPGSVVIFIRYVAYGLTPEEVDRVRRKARSVGADHKDGDMARIDLSLFDFHIGSSNRSYSALLRLLEQGAGRPGAFAGLLYQRYDRRLDELTPASHDALRPVYVGWPGHAAIPGSLRDRVRVLPVIKEEEMRTALRELHAFNLHWAVRPSIRAETNPALARQYKPFTKGLTAAACNANVLVNEQVDDAVDFLTPDYPYLIRSNEERVVEEGFRRACDDFGGPQWQRGLDLMRRMKELVSPPQQAKQFLDIVTRAAD